MPAIVILQPPGGTPREIPIGNTATIGRTSVNDLVLEGDALVSRQHAVIRCQNGAQFQIVDLGSRNGTFVDGRQVVLPVTLREGSKIQIGKTSLTFQFVQDEGNEAGMDHTIEATMPGAAVNIVDAAILVCDIRGFSTFSEKLPAPEIAQFIGKWFLGAGAIVERNAGQIDKFIGDAILAYWTGEPQNACRDAYQAAAAMEQLARTMTWPVLGGPVCTAIALHHGSVSCGNVGTVAQRDATIMGDTVNTVFRLEAAMKGLGASVLCSSDFYNHIPDCPDFRDFGEIELKGKSRLVRVFGRS